jgi:hypothetical protein
LKLELDEQERRAVGRSLVDRKALLIENAGDTTKPQAVRRSGLLELKANASVLRKLRAANGPRNAADIASSLSDLTVLRQFVGDWRRLPL